MLEQWRSHRVLLRRAVGSGSACPDAVVVPAARPVAHLHTAANLARDLGCMLVVLGSHAARSAEFEPLGSRLHDLRWAAIDLPADYHHELLDFETSTIAHATAGRVGDLSVKRNLGLLLARLVGWQTMLFLDDDINKVDPGQVRQAAAELDHVAVAGLEVGEFPDNSVVCHANRLVRHGQDVFVSGSALLVGCDRQLSFFPETYNEDWLFYFDQLAERSVAMIGSARQRDYPPFNPRRARREEFGDVLAEGLVDLLHSGRDIDDALAGRYWDRTLEARGQFIASIAEDLGKELPIREVAAAQRALEAAEAIRSGLDAKMFVEYVSVWRHDLETWWQRLARVKPVRDLRAALRDLDLDGSAVLSVATAPAKALAAPGGRFQGKPALQIAPNASIAPSARIGVPYRPLFEGDWDRLGRPTKIANECQVSDFCVVGEEAWLGPGCIMDAYTMVSAGATVGAGVLLTHRATVDSKAIIGDNCIIGGLVAERSRVGDGCRIFGDLVHRQLDPTSAWDADESMEGSPRVEDGAFVGWGATVIGGVTIGAGAYICARAIVTRNVPAGHLVSSVNLVRRPDQWNGQLARSPFFRVGHHEVVSEPDGQTDLRDVTMLSRSSVIPV